MKGEHIILLYSLVPSKVELKKLINPLGFPENSVGKESACNAGDLGSIPGFDPWVRMILWRRERLPTQYSGLENSMDCIAHGVTKCRHD